MKKIIGKIVAFVLASVAVFLVFWFTLPPLNLRSPAFWIFLLISFAIYLAAFSISKLWAFFVEQAEKYHTPRRGNQKEERVKLPTSLRIAVWVAILIVPCMLLASLIGSPLFNADAYRNLLQKEDGNFSQDVAELSMTQIPVVDRETAMALGNRKLGEMADLVSQFEIAEDYTQINRNNTPVRVTPLAYGDIIKWLNNYESGIPAYLQVDMVTQEASLIRLEEEMKYTESDLFMRYIHRYLRFSYPTFIFDDVSFEVDDNGIPYWVASTITYRIGLWNGADISGAVLVNAVTGEKNYYPLEKIPTWVDQVFSSDMIIEHLNNNGAYIHGFFNAYFGQRDVLQTTEGYNYIALNDDVWLYTGLTSANSDESNVGFVLVNLRTKETKYYVVPGAEEYSAMSSAEGQVQEKNYSATFPLLLNVADRPTYFLSLKDAAGLVKMYAFVDVEQYQVVGTGNSVTEARENYIDKLSRENITDVLPDKDNWLSLTGAIEEIHAAVVNGNTTYYFRLVGSKAVFTAPVTMWEQLPFLKAGDTVTVYYAEQSGTPVAIKDIA